MKSAVFSILAAAALAVVAAPLPSASVAVAQAKQPKSLKGTSYLPARRKPYAKMQKSDLIATRKFYDPAWGPRAQGQPFDNGFFFETPSGPFGGYTPYMH